MASKKITKPVLVKKIPQAPQGAPVPHEEPKPPDAPSEEYGRFEDAMRAILSVPKKDVDKAMEKAAKKRKKAKG